MTATSAGSGGFTAFFRRYTKTWLHGVSTAALTAFGALAVLHRGFVAVAIAAYVLPPLVLYVTGRGPATAPVDAPPDGSTAPREAASGDSATASTGSADGMDGGEAGGRAPGASGPDRPAERSGTSDAGGSVDPDADPDQSPAGHWRRVDAPTGTPLHDVVLADGAGYAVGDDGVLVADDGSGWRTVLADGPGAAGQPLRGVDATDDGGAIWIAGDGGTVARVDSDAERHVDFTAPLGRTDNLTDVAVAGPRNDEVVLLVNGSGEVLRGRYRDGDLAWDEPVEPGGGSSIAGVALADASTGYCCDTNDGVFETTDGGESFRRIGVDSADGTLTDVATDGPADCTVSADDGVVHRHDGGTWTPVRLCDHALAAIATRDGRGVACGDRSVFERPSATGDWERSATAAPGPLAGVALGRSRAVAVGREGAILERT